MAGLFYFANKLLKKNLILWSLLLHVVWQCRKNTLKFGMSLNKYNYKIVHSKFHFWRMGNFFLLYINWY